MNPNVWVVTSDWHVVSSDSETGITGRTKPSQAAAVSAYIRDTIAPAGTIDLGDCKDHYGHSTGDELDQYIANARSSLPWATVRAAESAQLPILPGNHDEVDDYKTPGSTNDFSLFDARFWAAPYHWAADWPAASIRFLAIHTEIHHSTDIFAGAGHVTSQELDWLQARIDEMPSGYCAIVCSHFPANVAFGNQIKFVDGTYYTDAIANPLTELLAANSSRIAAYLGGHRHGNLETNRKDGVLHFNLPGVSYSIGNGLGGVVPITYDPQARTLTFDYLLARTPFARYAGYTPVVVQLPPIPADPPTPDPSFSFTATGTVTINGVQHTATLNGTGALT